MLQKSCIQFPSIQTNSNYNEGPWFSVVANLSTMEGVPKFHNFLQIAARMDVCPGVGLHAGSVATTEVVPKAERRWVKSTASYVF